MSKHTLEQDFQHFMAYTNSDPADEAKLRVAYEHGASRGATRLEIVEDRLLTLVNAIKQAADDPLNWSNWTPAEQEAINAAMKGETP